MLTPAILTSGIQSKTRHQEIVTPRRARNAMSPAAITASIAPTATMSAIVALKNEARRIASNIAKLPELLKG
jgi:hypothetical protein